jgi:type VI secretion system secreted protein Hcp
MSALRRSPIHRTLAAGILAGAVAATTVVASSSATPRARQASRANGTYLVWGAPMSGQSDLARRVIRLTGVTFGVQRDFSVAGGTDRRRSAPALSELTLAKALNNDTSPRLLQAFVDRSDFDQVTIKFVRNGHTYLVAKLTDVLVSGYSLSSGGSAPTENVTLNFSKIEFKVGRQDTQPGTVDKAGWDLTAANVS